MKISGTFLDEISHDIPHQNWGHKEWEQDFAYMKAIGIDTVILIRCGYKRWQTFPSKVLQDREGAYAPPCDLVALFLELAGRYGMAFYFGIYDSGKYWWENGDFEKEVDINLALIDEVWQRYGQYPAFQGWYLSQEVSRRTKGIMDLYARLGHHCKAISSNLPVLISPYIDGQKAILSSQSTLRKADNVSLKQHWQDWNDIFEGIRQSIDIVAFQDGQVDYHELPDYLAIHKELAQKHHLHCWTNVESFDRDMPIKFLPIKWEKLKLKLEAAGQAGIEKAITFEFSHFMSPQSSYIQAHHLYKRYQDYLQTK